MRRPWTIRLAVKCLLLGWLAVVEGAETPPDDKSFYAEAIRFSDRLGSRPLPAPNPEEETEATLLDDMVSGHRQVDLTFCRRIGLDAMSERLLPILEEPFSETAGKGDSHIRETLIALRLFLLRGRVLCQQGKVAEGQAWLLKAHRMARRPLNGHNMINCMVAMTLDEFSLAVAAGYAEAWTEPNRLAYVRSLESLQPLGRIDLAFQRDQSSISPEHRASTLIVALKPLTPAQREKKLREIFGPIAPFMDDFPTYLRRTQSLLEIVTPESYESMTTAIAQELRPLTAETLKAFEGRNADALALVKEDESSVAPVRKSLSQAQKAEALYRVLDCSNIASLARRRLDLELKAELLKLALRRGQTFDESCIAGLTNAAGKPLRLGISKDGNRKAILVGDEDFLVIGPIK